MFDLEEIQETIEILVEMAKECEHEGDLENAQFYSNKAFKIAETYLGNNYNCNNQ